MNHASTKLIPTEEERQALYTALRAWTGNPTIADDLVQQTLLEAWKSNRQPTPEEWRPWLFGVARNVLMRWRREISADLRRTITAPQSESVLAAASLEGDIDIELEQQEIVSLLHDMLEALPPETREILLLKYIHELPQTEIAKALDMNEKALEGRLHRGKKKLRTHLLTYKPDTAVSLGIVTEPNTWQTTNIWCTTCGMHRLEARWYNSGKLVMDCPSCSNGWLRDSQRSTEFSAAIEPQFVPVRPSFRKAMSAVHSVNDDAMQAGRDGSWPCANCHGTVHPRAVPPDPEDTEFQTNVGFDLCYACKTCGAIYSWRYLPASGIYTSAGKAFEHRNKRVRMLPPIEDEHQGRASIRSTWESIDGSSEFVSWYDLETWRLLDTIASDIEST